MNFISFNTTTQSAPYCSLDPPFAMYVQGEFNLGQEEIGQFPPWKWPKDAAYLMFT